MVLDATKEQLLNIVLDERNFSTAKIDWDELLGMSFSQSIFPYVYLKVKNLVPENKAKIYNGEFIKHTKKVDAMKKEITSLTNLCKKRNVNVLVVKGLPISSILYNNIYLRDCNDIDTLVNEDDIQRMHSILLESGYVHACGKDNPHEPDPDDLLVLSSPTLKDFEHHEYFEYHKKVDQTNVETEVGRYIHQSVKKDAIKQFLKSSQEICIDTHTKVLTLDLNHTFLYLCENFYENMEGWYSHPKLRDILDLIVAVNKYGSKINWDQIVELAVRYKITDILYYIFINFGEYFRNSDVNTSSIINQLAAAQVKDCKRFAFAWETPLFDLFFLTAHERAQEIRHIVRKRCFSANNKNYVNPLVLTSHDQILEWELVNDSPYKVSVLISADKSENQIRFMIQVDDHILDDESKYKLTLVIIKRNPNDPYLEHEFLIEHDAIHRNNDPYAFIRQNGKVVIEEVVKLSELDECFSFSVCLQKHVTNNLWYWLSENPFHKDFWFDPPIVKIGQ